MEERIIDDAKRIFLTDPNARIVKIRGGKGYRTNNNTPDGVLDMIGVDATIVYDNFREMKGQVKCGTYNNFSQWGRERKSFVLGDARDLIWNKDDWPIRFCDLLLVGYETGYESKKIGPYCLIRYYRLIDRIIRGSLKLEKDNNSVDGNQFCWISYEKLCNANVIVDDGCGGLILDVQGF